MALFRWCRHHRTLICDRLHRSLQDECANGVSEAHGSLGDNSPEQSSTLSPLDNKDMTVSQLLLSLRKERQRGDQLQEELQRSAVR